MMRGTDIGQGRRSVDISTLCLQRRYFMHRPTLLPPKAPPLYRFLCRRITIPCETHNIIFSYFVGHSRTHYAYL